MLRTPRRLSVSLVESIGSLSHLSDISFKPRRKTSVPALPGLETTDSLSWAPTGSKEVNREPQHNFAI